MLSTNIVGNTDIEKLKDRNQTQKNNMKISKLKKHHDHCLITPRE